MLRLVFATVLALFLVVYAAASSATTILRLDSDPGQLQLDGQSVSYDDSQYTVSVVTLGSGNTEFIIGPVSIGIASNAATSSMPPFHTGKYYWTSAQGRVINDPTIGLSTDGGSGVCDSQVGVFIIRDLGFSDAAQTVINKIALDFIFLCDGDSPQVRGYLRYNSSVPLIVAEPTAFAPVLSTNLAVADEPITLYGALWLPGTSGMKSMSWTQTSGAAVSLSPTVDGESTFTAPDVPSGGAPYQFQVTVKNKAGLTDSDTAVVFVQANSDQQSGFRLIGTPNALGFDGPAYDEWFTDGSGTYASYLAGSPGNVEFQYFTSGLPLLAVDVAFNADSGPPQPGQWYTTLYPGAAPPPGALPTPLKFSRGSVGVIDSSTLEVINFSEACNTYEGMYYVIENFNDSSTGLQHFAANLIYQCEETSGTGNALQYLATPPVFVEMRVNSTAPYDNPLARDSSIKAISGMATTVDIKDNVTDRKHALVPTLTYVMTPPSNGQVTVHPITGAVSYRSKPGYIGPDIFTYVIADNVGYVSNVATINVNVAAAAKGGGGSSGGGKPPATGGNSGGGGGGMDIMTLLSLLIMATYMRIERRSLKILS